ncbi:MAG TPA: carboxypeptidase regulatory-like domain-containing protein [Candidatus Kapabacteria bacterium]|nr:carboxypeptidase regulatory-like domain-containing protein [Candidatus Kapabacteria bacterium]
MKYLYVVCLILISVSTQVLSQITTGTISGQVIDNAHIALKSATIIAVHLPSGSKYGTITRKDGRYNIEGMRVGGPYKVTASFTGFESKSFDNVQIQLGNNISIDFELTPMAIQTNDVVVSANKDAIFDNERTGASAVINVQDLNVLPTISRRIGDFTRLMPQSKVNFLNGNNFAGQDDKLNNIMVDGSYINNSFGLASEPGARTGVAPISIDALEQIQINIAPYDVRQGNFVGAAVNMVTKSGTNTFSGSLYYQNRNENFVGTQAKSSTFNPGTFNYQLIGASLGGPIIKNKLFFFMNFEKEDLISPGTTYLANNGNQTIGGNITRVLASDLDNLSSFLNDKFSYQTGSYQGYDFNTPALRMILKLDYNIDPNNKFTIRYSHLDSKADALASNSPSLGFGNRRSNVNALNFQNSNFTILENIRSVIGELNSTISDNMQNNLIVGYRFHDESREKPKQLFPLVDILKNGETYTTFGTETFTPSNKVLYSTIQFQNNLSIFLNNHSILVGLSLEKYESENVFFPASQSVYVYNSLNDFFVDANDYIKNPNRTTSPINLNRFQYRYSNIPDQSEPLQLLKVIFAGAYLQDNWLIKDNLTLIAGIRFDMPFFSPTGYENTEANNLIFKDENGNDVKYQTQKLPNANILYSPRIGFNWDILNDKTMQIRGGSGMFTGQPAFVWISNQIGNNGVLTGFERYDNTTERPFNPDPNAYKPNENMITGKPASNYELSLTDPNFKFPQVWRTNIAFDKKISFLDLIATLEFIYTKDINRLKYVNVNLSAPNSKFAGPDQRDRWTASNKIHQNIANAIVLKNQDQGYAYNLTASIERQISNGFYGKMAYTYGVSKNLIDDGSIAYGSWSSNAISNNPNNPDVGFTYYTPDSRFFTALIYKFDYLNVGSTTLSLFFDAYNNGRNSYVYGGDFNGDGVSNNDLIYIPKDKSEMFFQNYSVNSIDNNGNTVQVYISADEQANAFENYISQDEYLSSNRGKIAVRNGVKYPMVSRIDFSLSQEFYTELFGNKNSFELRFDIINLTNLLNSDWGVGQMIISNQPLLTQNSSGNTPLYRMKTTSVGFDANNNPKVEFLNKSFTNTAFINDVYRMQLTIKYKFN